MKDKKDVTPGKLHYEIMRRCYSPKSIAYKSYGAVGIKVCPEWHNRENFVEWCIENGYQKGMTLERIESKGDYCPENCRFGRTYLRSGIGQRATRVKMRQLKAEKKKYAAITGRTNEDPLYGTYNGMHTRCENKKHSSYKNYGGRGISVCKEWSGKDGFFEFKAWAIQNGWRQGLSLDRANNDKGYCPQNCRWVEKEDQPYNKRNNLLYEYCGIMMPLGAISKLAGVKYGLLYSRVRIKGTSVSEAIAEIKNNSL